MSRVPTYMILDDHEIKNDWTQDEYKRFADRFAIAMHAYHSYQLVHGPAFTRNSNPDESEIPKNLWYSFRHGCSEFFVMDTRTERYIELEPPEIISAEQMTKLKHWLTTGNDTIKFIVTSVPFFPDTLVGGEDRWSGFKEQRNEILDFIRENEVRRVVFLSGDVHISGTAQLVCSTDPNFRVSSVISSPFYWPYPQMKRSHFKTEGVLTTSGEVKYLLDNTGEFYNTDNFTRVFATLDQLRVEVYGRKGVLLGIENLGF